MQCLWAGDMNETTVAINALGGSDRRCKHSYGRSGLRRRGDHVVAVVVVADSRESFGCKR